MRSEHHSFPLPPHLLKHMICHDAWQAQLAPRLCRALPAGRCRSPPVPAAPRLPERPPAPAPSSAVLRPEGDGVCAHGTFCLGPRIAGLSTDSRQQFRVTGDSQPRCRRGGGGHGQKVTLAGPLPDSCRFGSRSGGGGGAGRPAERTGPVLPPAVPSQPRRAPRRSPRPPRAAAVREPAIFLRM